MIVHPMVEVYGQRKSERLDDETWIADATAAGWALLHKDTAIGRLTDKRPGPHLAALVAVGARAFCVMSGNLTAQAQADRILRHNRDQIEHLAVTERGPYVYGLFAHGIVRSWPRAATSEVRR